MVVTKRASYYCTNCNSHRQLGFNDTEHQLLVMRSNNGLVAYSDIHPCKFGLTSVNQLSIDKDYHVRSFEKMELPKMRLVKTKVPSPNTGTERGTKKLHLTQMPKHLDIHVVLQDLMMLSELKIGRFNHEDLLPFTTISSDMGMLQMDIYPTGTSYTPQLEQWLTQLVSILEILPPTTIGLLVDTLRYIADNGARYPETSDTKFIMTILASHEIFFEFIDYSFEKAEQMKKMYDAILTEDDFKMIDKFIRVMRDHEMAAIKDFMGIPTIQMDLLAIIYLFLVLEEEKIIKIERPGILESSI